MRAFSGPRSGRLSAAIATSIRMPAPACAVALGIGLVSVAQATTYLVNTAGDPGPMNTQSLRQAIATANASSGNTIQFDASLVGGTITLTQGELLISQPMTITGPGAGELTISGNDASRIFLVESGGGLVTFSGLTLAHGNAAAPLSGAGIAAFFSPVSVQNSIISGNASKNGAGIFAYASDLTITGSRISDNVSDYEGGGIVAKCNAACNNLTISQSTIAGNRAGQFGGGIYAYKLHGVSISQTLISGNRNPLPGGQQGGGLFIYATGTTPVISNSTISNNYAHNNGGGIYADSALIEFTTIAGNSTGNAEGNGLHVRLAGSVTLNQTIVANNFSGAGTVDVSGALTANFSLIRNGGSATIGGTSKLVGVDPQLGALADHGGPTLTMVPASGSPAVNGGPSGQPPSLDQRGLPRPVGANVDMGAVERQVVEDVIFRDGFNFEAF
jgi:predicted outer membrane repeat protein